MKLKPKQQLSNDDNVTNIEHLLPGIYKKAIDLTLVLTILYMLHLNYKFIT